MAYTGTFDFPEAKSGDWWGGVPEITLARTNTDGGALARVRIEVRRKPSAPAELALDSATGGVSIDDEVNWVVSVPGFEVKLDAGEWRFEIVTVDSLGHAKRYLAGGWKVLDKLAELT